MKTPILLIFTVFFAFANGVFVPPRHRHRQQHLLGDEKCTWGPSYWCQNLTSAADCHATQHCIQTVWLFKQLEPDTSEICQTCIEMVKEARDQLESNETQELLKEVFEGTCALIHIKTLVKECDKIADQYIPDLIETLASEMNPQVVCSVAGLCNNEKLLQAMAEAGLSKNVDKENSPVYQCQQVVPLVKENFAKASKEEVRDGFLEFCRGLSSFTDTCSNIVIKYFNELYEHLQDNLNVRNVCGLFSTSVYHLPDIEVMPASHVGYVNVNGKDDLACEFCEQMVGHLRDLLTANTTELEFKKVLEGLCKQTGSFKNECLDLADQYYDIVYNYLVSELNASAICMQIGICPRSGDYVAPPLAPLLHEDTLKTLESSQLASTARPLHRVNIGQDEVGVRPIQTAEQMQLPIERMMPPHMQEVYNSQTCVFCEYVMHYLQQTLTNPANEKEIEDALNKLCDDLPSSVNATCTEFVKTYGDAVIALVSQEIDPSHICPLIKACPDTGLQDVEIFMQRPTEDSKCPLCLFAVSKLEDMIKDEKTEDNIRNALDHLCDALPSNLASECTDFVNTYTNQLIELLIADFTPQEVCVYLKLCTDDSHHVDANPGLAEDIETNEIPDNTVNGIPMEIDTSVNTGPQCILCEFVMKEIDDALKNKSDQDEIKRVVHNICSIMPKSIADDCNNFVNQYGDTIIELLVEALEPSEICSMMKLCAEEDLYGLNNIHDEIKDCAICESLTVAIEKLLHNPKIDHSPRRVLHKACLALPEEDRAKCYYITQTQGQNIYDWVSTQADKHFVCSHVGLCAQNNGVLIGANPCTRGPSYWCTSEKEANECNAIRFCIKNSWNRQKRAALGEDKCSWGPSYWCESEENARKCNAVKHCQDFVWNSK